MSNGSDAQQPEKWSACDRCRTQKLRCHRVNGHPTDACTRCIHAQVECITSSFKRPGRPARNSANNAPPPPQSADPHPNSCGATAGPADTAMDIPLANMDDWLNPEALEPHYKVSATGRTSVDSSDVYSQDFSLSGGSTAFTVSSLSSPLTGGPAEMLTDPPPGLPADSCAGGPLQLFGHGPAAPNYDPGLRLAVLYRELSKQLFALRSMPWDMAEVLQITCTHGDGAKPFPTHADANPLGGIAQHAAEFAELLWSFQAPGPGDGNGGGAAPNGTAAPPLLRLSIVDRLTTLSCHILIISIFEAIFGHFIDQSLHGPGAAGPVTRGAPRLCLGGVAVPPWPNMLGHLLVGLTEAQLRPLERLLGLPDEFCVSRPEGGGGGGAAAARGRRPSSGPLSGDGCQSLLTALKQAEVEKTAGKGGGLGVIESLKEKMRRVQSPQWK